MSKLEYGAIDEDIINLISNYIGVMNFDENYLGSFLYSYKEFDERCIEVISFMENSESVGDTAYNNIGGTNIIYRTFPKEFIEEYTEIAVCELAYDKIGLLKAYQSEFKRQNYCRYNKGQILFESSFIYMLKELIREKTFISKDKEQKELKKFLCLTDFYGILLENNGGIGSRCNSAMKDDIDRIDQKLIPFPNFDKEEQIYAVAYASMKKDDKLSDVREISSYQKLMQK